MDGAYMDRAMTGERLGVFGAGLAGCCTALALARRGIDVDLIDRADAVMSGASLHNEGKLHLGYVYAADRTGLTHTLMARGSLSFLPILEHLTGSSGAAIRCSAPFLYGVPPDSQLGVDAIEAHFRRVDETLRQVVAEGGPFVQPHRPDPVWRVPMTGAGPSCGVAGVQAAFQTAEISVDTQQVADLLRDAVHSHERIRLRLGCHILSAAHVPGGGVEVQGLQRGEPVRLHYRYGVNCTWEDRLRLDASLGIRPARPWLMRYKAALTLHLRRPVPPATLPSLTLITGLFGDVVNHRTNKIFASWYPVCKLAETRDIDGLALHAAARSRSRPALVQDSLAALARFVPALADITPEVETVDIGGGVIFAWGETDIDDPDSGLHQRHAIGTTFHKDWASMDTGKYCMAPYYALALADAILAERVPAT